MKKIIELIQTNFEDVKKLIKIENKEGLTDNLCLITSEFFNNSLKNQGWRCSILEGEIILDENSYLEHYVSLVYLQNFWITIDFTASQLEKYKETSFLIIISETNKHSLIRNLKASYNWWFPNNE